jgi:hypothetical protein
MPTQVYDGKQLAAGRVLAGLGIRELAAAAGIAPRTLHRLETMGTNQDGTIHASDRKRHGHVQLVAGTLMAVRYAVEVSSR